jgi:hypothetical protein
MSMYDQYQSALSDLFSAAGPPDVRLLLYLEFPMSAGDLRQARLAASPGRHLCAVLNHARRARHLAIAAPDGRRRHLRL